MNHTHPTPGIPPQTVTTYTDGLVPTPPPPHTDTTSLVEMLSRIDALDVIPRLQVATTTANPTLQLQTPPPRVPGEMVQDNVEVTTTPLAAVAPAHSSSIIPVTMVTGSELSQTLMVQLPSQSESKKPRVGRPRTKPPKEHKEWHYHLGGMRHSRVPLTPELKEVLEVAYVSRIMSKNFRKEGQPEKERIARITGMDLDKVQEWFKNRRKKDKLGQERMLGHHLPKGRRGQRSSTGSIGGVSEIGPSHSLEQQVAMVMEGGVAMETEGGVAVGQQIEIQQPQTQPQVATLGHPTLQTPVAIPTEAFTTSKQLH